MKLSRQLAGGAAAALVGLIALPLSAATASAERPIFETVDAGTLPAETSPYATDTWFIGGGSLGTARTTTQGTILDGTAGKVQLMRSPLVGEDSLDFLQLSDIRQPLISVISGSATFQVAVMYDHDGDSSTTESFTTLRPLATNTASTAGDWTTSRDILNADGSVQFEKNKEHSFYDLSSALTLKSVHVMAFGVFVNSGQTAVLSSTVWGNLRSTFATPITPTFDETSTPVPLNIFTAMGAEFVMRDLPPGQRVQFQVFAPNRPEFTAALIVETFTANDNGVLRAFFKAPAGESDLIGEWNIFYTIEGPILRNGLAGGFEVVATDGTANPPAVDHQDDTQATIQASDSSQKPTPTSAKVEILPVTGSDSVAAATFAGVLLSVGAALALFARRRAAAK